MPTHDEIIASAERLLRRVSMVKSQQKLRGQERLQASIRALREAHASIQDPDDDGGKEEAAPRATLFDIQDVSDSEDEDPGREPTRDEILASGERLLQRASVESHRSSKSAESLEISIQVLRRAHASMPEEDKDDLDRRRHSTKELKPDEDDNLGTGFMRGKFDLMQKANTKLAGDIMGLAPENRNLQRANEIGTVEKARPAVEGGIIGIMWTVIEIMFALALLLMKKFASLLTSLTVEVEEGGKLRRKILLADVPTIRLSNGVEMPVVAAGTCFRDCSKANRTPSGVPGNPEFYGFLPERAYRSLSLALEMGYMHIDTALAYRSQKQVGAVLARKFMDGELEREDVFLTSKLFHGEMPGLARGGTTLPLDEMTTEEVTEAAEEQFETVLEELGVGYVDLMLLHWPAVTDSKSPGNAARRLAAWRVLEKMHERGLARAIGVSNFSECHIEKLMEDGAEVLPMVNQIEASVYKSWDDIKSYCDERGIKLMAHSPLGMGTTKVLNCHVLKSIAVKKGATVAQVALRYLVQQGYAVLPLSTSEERLRQNLDLFSFELNDYEMEWLAELRKKDDGIGLPSPYNMS